jgi:SHS2 domain-containing protein
MSLDELKEKGDKYKELLEARDLEDILYKWFNLLYFSISLQIN